MQECTNLQSVLEETLRFKYGLEGSKEFFEECQARLTFIRDELFKADEGDHDNLRQLSDLLNKLSDLISRIERSSIGEYSWSFIEELKRIAIATCSEATAASPNTEPQFHVWSSGGLDAYSIQPELSRPTGSRKRIHTIVLPKTLKHSVLLHSILGHEIGHAMLRCSKHQHALSTIFNKLIANSPFENQASTAQWLYSNTAPMSVRRDLASPTLTAQGINQGNFFGSVASWQAWMEEVLCDFIGLITFGPSFVAAEANLLYAMDPSGAGIGARHPLVGCRVKYLLRASEIRGLDDSPIVNSSLKSSASKLWNTLRARDQTDPWFDVLDQNNIRAALSDFEALFGSLPPSLYLQSNERTLLLLVDHLSRLTPPVGFDIEMDQTISWQAVDFRSILYAGWIAAANDPSVPFSAINRLCGHAIMQQRAIHIELGRAS